MGHVPKNPIPKSPLPKDPPTTADEDIDELFERSPASLEELFQDPDVRKRIGELITLAMSRPARRRRRR